MITEDFSFKATNFCHSCNSITEHGVLFSYNYNVKQYSDVRLDGTTVFLAKCINCGSPSLREEDYEIIETIHFSHNKRELFPSTNNLALKNAPEIVIRPYKEAIKCFQAHAYDACVIMCRKGIEAICYDKGEINNKHNLATKLRSLNNKNILENTLYNWANELRLIGNDGAHSHDGIVTKQDAQDSINFFDSLITFLYHLVDQYEKLKIRRATIN